MSDMSDSTWMTVSVKGVRAGFLKKIKAELDAYYWEDCSGEQIQGRTAATYWAGDQRYGTQDEIISFLDALMTNGYEDLETEDESKVQVPGVEFAYEVRMDPKYDWGGEVTVKVPGVGEFHAECDANGQVQVPARTLHALIDGYPQEGEETILAVRIELLTGRRIVEAWETFK